MHESFFLKM